MEDDRATEGYGPEAMAVLANMPVPGAGERDWLVDLGDDRWVDPVGDEAAGVGYAGLFTREEALAKARVAGGTVRRFRDLAFGFREGSVLDRVLGARPATMP